MSLLMDFRKLYKKYNLNITGIIHIGAHYGDELDDYIGCSGNSNSNDIPF